MRKIKIVAIDYKMSNIFSIYNIFMHLGLTISISSSETEIKNADAIILPGVGAFGEAMRNLRELNLIVPIKEFIFSGKPCMGICLGLQLLFSKSYEFGTHLGLGIWEGEVIKFDQYLNNLRVPSIGWNTISSPHSWENTPLQGIKKNEFVYFVHSYFATPKETNNILSTTRYGDQEYCSSFKKDNVFATQFHPEKSGIIGLQIFKNWLTSI